MGFSASTLVAPIVTLAALLVPAGTAGAAVTASEDATTITITGSSGDDVTVLTDEGANVRITNAAATGAGCSQTGSDALCTRGARSVSASLQAGNDTLTSRTIAAGSFAGGGGGDAFAIGASLGADTVNGDAGTDLVDYLERAPNQLGGNVAVSVDGNADDGGIVEGDNIGSSIEAVRGTQSSGDTLNAATVDGDLGADTLSGTTIAYELATPYPRPSGPARSVGVEVDLLTLANSDGDTLLGGPQNVIGTSLAERLSGNIAANRIEAGGGADTLLGLGSADTLLAGAGDDSVVANDGIQDQVDCGAGNDSGQFDTVDILVDCEPPAPARDTTAPVISTLAVSPRAFATRKTRRHRRIGTRFRYSLSEAAAVRFTIERKVKGRRVRGKCRRQTRRNASSPRCTLYKRAGSFSQAGKQRSNTKRFSGKLRGRRLRPGTYRATLGATDAAGNTAQPKRVRFRVIR